MKLPELLLRTNLILGIISLVFVLWAGIHLQHQFDDLGGRHPGETVAAVVLALLIFAAGRYGARVGASLE
jgi:hypothetical protein